MSASGHHQVLVLGAGLAGLAAAGRLSEAGIDVQVLERSSRAGGLIKSRRVEGFTFDHGPHVSFTKREDIRALLAAAVGGAYRESKAELLNLWRGRWIPHPAQSHLHGLPVEVVERCLVDFVEALGSPAAGDSYEAWLLRHLGRAFCEEFTFRYTRKYWTAEAAQLTSDWVGQRMHTPPLREVIRGALAPQPADQHYITSYRYPLQGGFETYLPSVLRGQAILTCEEVMEVRPRARTVHTASGRAFGYERLVSTLPLPVLVERIQGAPSDVRDAAARLRCTSMVLVNVGVQRWEGFPPSDWMYFYDEDLCFARASLPHRLAEANAPAGCGSVQVEIHHSPYRPLPAASMLEAGLADLRRAGLLLPDDRILVAEEVHVPFANVIFDAGRAEALARVLAYLRELGLESCGRFGEWAYLWTDDAIHSGWRAAGRVLSRLGRPPVGQSG